MRIVLISIVLLTVVLLFRHVWQPNFVDTKSYKRGFMWKCFCCGKVKKELE